MTMTPRFSRRLLLLLAGAWALCGTGAGAATLTWNTTTNTWDFNTTADWSNGSGAVKWTSNLNTASFQPTTTGTVTVDNTNGQVGAAGIVVGGTASTWTITGAQLQLGSGGITDTLAGTFTLSAPVALTASQTWSSTRTGNNNNAAGFVVTGALSGTGNLIFDGRGLTSPTATANSNPRVTFNLGGATANTFSGSTTVTGGAVLRLDYTSGNVSRLDDSSALVLAGGTVTLNGNSGGVAAIETVGSTFVSAGANNFFTGPNGGGTTTVQINQIALGAISRAAGAGGTLDFANITALATTTTQNVNGVLGGWATGAGGTRWAVGSADGSATAITATLGTNRSASSAWLSTDNVNATASESGIVSRSVNNLLISATNGSLGLAAGATLTVNAGGIMANGTGESLTGGSVTSGMGTGELFVYSPNAFTLGSAIVNNGGTAVSLVKGGSNTLTLSGTSTYTGTTYVNAGTLALASGGSINNSARVVVQGGATFDVTASGGHTVGSGKSLSGGGTVLGNVTVASGGTMGPAFTYLDASNASHIETGTLTLGGTLTLQNGSGLTFDLGTNSDLLSLTGTSTLTGSASAGGISLSLFDAGGAAVGTTYTLMQWTGTTTLSDFNLTDFSVSGLTGTLALDTVNDKLTFTVSAVPEPSTLAFIALGLVALAAVVRRDHLGKAAA